MTDSPHLLARRPLAVVVTAACAVALAGCAASPGSAPAEAAQPSSSQPSSSQPSVPAPSTSAAPSPSATPTDLPPVSFAFVGDIHAEGSSERVIDDGLGPIADLLSQQDVAVANLETAVLTDPSATDPEPKRYTFAAPPGLLDALHTSGVDVVTLANNHGMDFGSEGLRQTLDAAEASPLAVIGAGRTKEAATAPWRTEVDGVAVAVIAATDVLDSFAVDSWPATDSTAGLASSKGAGTETLLSNVRRAAETADVVAVYLHWGSERVVCPTDRQRELAEGLAAAGADVVVGSHAHVVQPAARVDGTFVHYGLGNFVWYSPDGSESAETGVLTVTVDPDDENARTATWHPAEIRSGVPQLVGEPVPPPQDC